MPEFIKSIVATGGAARVKLRGPMSQQFTLADTTRLQLAWEPQHRSQHEIEVRGRIIATDAVIGTRPLCRWSAELAHGDAVWTDPQPAIQQIAGTPMLAYSMPARGFVFRTNAREFRLAVQNAGDTLGGVVTRMDVLLSILPCSGMHIPVYPRSDIGIPAAGVIRPFPIGATEWKLSTDAGLPLAAGGVVLTGIAGALIGPIAGPAAADWIPIAHDAVGWTPDSTMYAHYR